MHAPDELPPVVDRTKPVVGEPVEFDDGPKGWTVQRVLGVLVALALLGFWVWAFSPWAPNDKADAVTDRAFLETAKRSCGTMQDALDALPPAASSTDAAARADVVARSGPILAAMVAELRTAGATLQGRDALLVTQWLDDWDAYTADRLAYAEKLRTDEGAEFIVTRRLTGQITVTMDGFSKVNDLKNCLVPLDV